LLELLGAPGDVLELRVAVWMLSPLARLAVGLQAVAQSVQRLADGLMAHRVALARQLGGQRAHALAGPAQRRHRVAPGGRLHQFLERRAQPRVDVDHAGTTGAWAPHAMLRRQSHQLSRVAQFLHPRRNRRTRQADCARDGADAAIPQRTSLCRRPKPAHLFVHHVAQRLVLLGDPGFVIIHPIMVSGRTSLEKVIC